MNLGNAGLNKAECAGLLQDFSEHSRKESFEFLTGGGMIKQFIVQQFPEHPADGMRFEECQLVS
jgi:hypothetical protein